MAQLFAASIYRIGRNNVGTVQGSSSAFSPATIRAYAAPAGTTGAGNVTMNSIIQVLPGGLNQQATLYYTPMTVAQIITAANA